MVRLRKRILYITAILIAVLMALGVGLLITPVKPADAAVTEGGRVEMKDLFKLYPIDAVIGPVDVKDINNDGKIDRNDLDKTGHFTYFTDPAHTDIEGNYTNNIYGIPANRYFDVESYIYAPGERNSTADRTLYGWKPAIQGVHPDGASDAGKNHPIGANNGIIAENGEIMTGGYLTASASPIGIYVRYNGAQFFGTTFKYALIVPEDITAVGQGSAAFVGYDSDSDDKELRSYYDDITYPNNPNDENYDSKYAAQYTDFACFCNKGINPLASAPYFWQPRERLAGVFFPEGSRLKEITGSTKDGIAGEDESNRTNSTKDLGKSAFLGCDNLRFMILPDATTKTSGVTNIGMGAFYNCALLTDTNIPNSVTSIGSKAYAGCGNLIHISLPKNNSLTTIPDDVFNGCNKIRHVDNKEKYAAFESKNSTIFVMGNKPENGVKDAGAFFFELTSGGKLSALSLAGETGENSDKLFVFPSAADFIDGEDRRSNVSYDYLDCEGKKITNRLSDLTAKNSSGSQVGLDKVDVYDVAASFAMNVWCQNVILPKEVKTIGEKAFYTSHVKYLETYATTINSKAFNDTNSTTKNQWFYFHQIKTGNSFTQYNIASDAFVVAANGVQERHIVLENQDLYTFATNNNNGNFRANVINKMSTNADSSCRQYVQYMIPVIAHINNEDNQTVTIDQSNMTELFYNDSDFLGNVYASKGNDESITYTKRLSNSTSLSHTVSGVKSYDSKKQDYAYEYVKQRTGEWSSDPDAASKNTNPALSNMESTKWFADAACSTETDAKRAHNGAAPSTDIYTKNIARPENIKNGNYDGVYKGRYTYGDTYTFGTTDIILGDNDTASIDYYKVLGLSSGDYVIELESFAYPAPNTDDGGKPKNLLNAGTYRFNISLNSKWGKWSTDFIKENSVYTTASATVGRKKVDVSKLSVFPKFVNAEHGDAALLHGNATSIYSYNDGWYAAQQNGQELNDTRTVTNAYCYYVSGKDITIKFAGEVVSADGTSSTLGDYIINSRNGLKFRNSSAYTASFNFTLKNVANTSNQYNYYYYYGDDENTKYDNVADSDAGLSMTTKQDFSFRLTKRWYIVMESNMFVVKNGGSEPYAPLDNSTVTYGDTITAKEPALDKGDAPGNIQFEILYTPIAGRAVTITGNATNSKLVLGDGENSIDHYINSSMPAGEYTLTLHGAEVPPSRPITGEYVITVLPREFDVGNTGFIQTLHNAMGNNGAGNAYPVNPVSGSRQLHGSIANLLGGGGDKAETLNGSLKLPATGNYWSDKNGYFSNAVTITYNWEGSGRTGYNDLDYVVDRLNTAGEYTIYYCISAKNYVTVGGEDSSDRTDRSFTTTYYTEMRVDDLYGHIIGGTYFQNVTYSGETVQPRIPNDENSQYYSYAFTDADYVNARENASVTLTLRNPALARWNTTLSNGRDASQYFELSADKASLKVFFDILPATNSFTSTPQMIGWNYKGFNQATHIVTSTLAFHNDVNGVEATVYYKLADSSGNEVDLGQAKLPDAVNGSRNYFTVIDGQVSSAVRDVLNDLHADTYKLYSYVSAIGSNVNACEWKTSSGVEAYSSVLVSQATNRWTTTPSFTTWQYTRFTKDSNFIAGVPAFATANDVVYTLIMPDNSGFVLSHTNGTLSDDAVNKLKALDKGAYTIHIELTETTDYSGFSENPTVTVITTINNQWKTLPAISGWTYGQYNPSLLTNGSAEFGAVTFTVQTIGTDGNVSGNLSGYTGTFDYLKGNLGSLNAGSYNLFITSKGSTVAEQANYVAAERNIRFTVAMAENSWKTEPSIASSWQYGSTPPTPVTGVLNNTEGGTLAVATKYYKTTETGGQINIDKTQAWADLPTAVGTYARISSAPAGTNYKAKEHVSYFTITRKTIAWKDGKAPVDEINTVGKVTGYVVPELADAYSEYKNLIIFEIVKSGSNTKQTCTSADVEEIIEGLSYGTYIVSIRVGGDGYSADFKSLADEYNAIYEPLTATTVINITLAQLKFSTSLSVTGWTYGKFATECTKVNAVVDIDGDYSDKTQLKTDLGISDELITYTISEGSRVVGTGNDLGELLKGLAPGTYSATATVESDKAYLGVSETVAFTVTKAQRGFTFDSFKSDNDSIEWTYTDSTDNNDENVKKMKSVKFEYETVGDGKDLVIYLNGTRLTDNNPSTLYAELRKLGNGYHTVRATVEESNYYAELTQTVNILVTRADNEWYKELNVPQTMVINGVSSKKDTEEPGKATWVWDSIGENAGSGFCKAPIPASSATVDITIEKIENGSRTIIYGTTLHYTNHELVSHDDDGLLLQLRRLDVGSYSIKAVIPQTEYYNELSHHLEIEVTKAANSWNYYEDSNGNKSEYAINTQNGFVTISMDPHYKYEKNKIIYKYIKQPDSEPGKEIDPNTIPESEWSTQLPMEKGTYFFKADYAEGPNFKAMETTYGTYSLEKDANGWMVAPGVNGWEWNAFDKDVNIFRGSAISDSPITFEIKLVGNSTIRALTDGDFYFYPDNSDAVKKDISPLQGRFSHTDGVTVSDNIAQLLKALKPGKYSLTAYANGDEDHEAISASFEFEITRATNEWYAPEGSDVSMYPNIDSFVYGSTPNFTKGSTKYGMKDGKIQGVNYVIYDENGKSCSEYSDLNKDPVKSFINTLSVGSYVLHVWVDEDKTNGIYSGLHDKSHYMKPFTIRAAQNSWKEGKAPETPIIWYYSELQGVKQIGRVLPEPEAQQGTPVYQILNTNYSPVQGLIENGKAKIISYNDLLDSVKVLSSGDYIIRISIDGDTLTNYENFTTDISLSIKSYTAKFKNLPEKLGGQWQQNNTVLDKLEDKISAYYGIADEKGEIRQKIELDNVRYSYGLVVEGTWNDLAEEVMKLHAGSYQIVITASYPTDRDPMDINICETISATIQLDIRQGTNEWLNNWNVSNSLGTASRDNVGGQWTWGSTINWAEAKPKYGNIVYVEIRKDGASEALNYITVDYDADDKGVSAIASVGAAISALDADEYRFIVTSPADTDWAMLTSNTTFRISPAGNEWKEVPNILISVNNEWKNASYVEGTANRYWTYNTAARPEATALHGTVTYTYYAQGSIVALSGIPANAGKYKVVFSVEAPKSGNYAGLSGEINFEIVRATDSSFIVSPGTTGWTWNEYDRMNNLFTGIPTTRGAVSFAVLYDGKAVAVDGTKLEDIQLVNDKGEHTGNPDKDIYVTKAIGELLNKLNAGSYVLRIDVAEVDNYNGFSANSTFVVSPATNLWTTTPRIISWSLGKWLEKDNLPKAQSKYGEVNIVISSKVEGDAVIYYSSIYNEKTGEYDVVNKLDSAPAGWYVMNATVAAATGQYNNALSEEYEFQVFVTGSVEVGNSWVTDATISNWTASKNIKDINMPEATPLRGLTWFEFTDRISGKKITADDESFEIEADTAYFQNFYIPMAPGKYSMTAYAARRDADGNTYDRILSESVNFEIFYRENSWESEPRISSILYLGEKAEWEGPAATATEAGSKITYSYRDAETGLPLGSEISMIAGVPAKAGKYILTATATAEYCSILTSHDVEFIVDYSYNGWISGVRIESWSAEYEPNDPAAEALFGTDKIVYTYATQDAPDVILPGKPTEEGNYIVYANIDCEKDGYANISDKFEFTIEPAFDIDLLIVDIVLGTVGCVMAAGVIYLALRKRKRM